MTGRDERCVVVRTRDLQSSLTALLSWASSRGVALRNLDARSASLEEAFLAVAGSDSEATDDKEVAA
jgi:ABC-2 type transport system ATP-binding protein